MERVCRKPTPGLRLFLVLFQHSWCTWRETEELSSGGTSWLAGCPPPTKMVAPGPRDGPDSMTPAPSPPSGSHPLLRRPSPVLSRQLVGSA